MVALDQYIQKQQVQLSDNESMILKYILSHPEQVQNISIKDLSNELHISKSTILRFAQKIGFSGFSELKYFLKQDEIKEQKDGAIDLIASQTTDIQDTQQFIFDYDFNPLCQTILDARTIYLYGTGHSQRSALKELAKNFLMCGKQAILLPAQTEFDINMPLIRAEDLVVIVSLSGETESIKPNVEVLNLRGVPIISVTNFSTNFLARKSTYRLYYQSTQLNIGTNEREVYSMIGISIVLDALYRKYFMYKQRKLC